MRSADLIVIGGGITGLGVARDAALRGFKVTLLERYEIGSGTSSYFHQILHSGARYAVTDPEAAAECYSENQILKLVVKDAIVDTGGLFLAFNEEEVKYADTLLLACKKARIPTAELSPQEVLQKEPRINKNLQRAFTVPSAHINGAKTIQMHMKSLKELGVEIITNCEVTEFIKNDDKIKAAKSKNNQIFEAEIFINATGVWAPQIGKMADIEIPVTGYKGSMIVFKEQFTSVFLNRCRLPSDGDLMLPTGSRYIVGTTSIKTDDIDTHIVEKWEIDKLLAEAEVMIPGISRSEIVRSYAGVRPIYTPEKNLPDRSESRSFTILDHQKDGVENFISMVGGKFMLYRLMSEKTVDLLCEKLNKEANCETAEVLL